MRKCCIWTIVGLLVVAVLAAIAITLGVVLSQHKSKDVPSLDDTISEDATFPNGSSIISANSLQQGPPGMAPLEVNFTMLAELGVRVDNSSLVAETGRLSYFYIRLPPSIPNNHPVKRQIDKDSTISMGYIGVRFGDSQTINIVPLNLTSIPASGLQIVGQLPQDRSTIYALQVRMPDSMCAGDSSGTCSELNWDAYSITSDEVTGRPGDFSTSLYVACGSQCDSEATSPCATSSCQKCNGIQVAGTDVPVTRRYNMGTKSANLTFTYNTYTIKDWITVTYEEQKIFDSGCVGEASRKTISYNGNSQELRVDVEPNCEHTKETQWNFQLSCPPPCALRNPGQSGPLLLNDDTPVNANDITYITADAQMPALVALACNDSSSNSFQWTLQISPTSKDNSICNKIIITGSGQQWNIRQAMGNTVQGGDALLSWTSGQKITGTLNFKILGQNPAIQDIKTKITQLTNLWYAPYIPGAESNYHQFESDGYPFRAPDNGYGLFQLTNTPVPNCVQVWSWIENAKAAVTKLQLQRNPNSGKNSAQNWMYGPYEKNGIIKDGQRVQAKKDAGQDVPVPDQKVGNCIFKDNTMRVIEDAVAIKMYNGATKMYCFWQNKVGNTSGFWGFDRISIVNKKEIDYVANVCKFVS